MQSNYVEIGCRRWLLRLSMWSLSLIERLYVGYRRQYAFHLNAGPSLSSIDCNRAITASWSFDIMRIASLICRYMAVSPGRFTRLFLGFFFIT